MADIKIKTCPFCGNQFAIFADLRIGSENQGNSNSFFFNINGCYNGDFWFKRSSLSNLEIDGYGIDISKCPKCKQDIITIEHGCFINAKLEVVKDDYLITDVRPKFKGISFPDCVPLQIRQDYEEASAILRLSPKASATLSRRCLQGMIRDHFGVVRGRLNDEIIAIHERKLISEDVWNALNALRELGNIGAHMEKDVDLIIDIDEGEAEKLVQLIEYLINVWYIEENKHALLIKGITDIAKDKKALKHSGSGNTQTETRTLTNNAPIKGDCNMNAGNITINSAKPKE